ncbi:hypothetical protein ACIPZF_24780 [Pseudomonas sp. NPDC089752]|uniref:hypothetical protein n=1 Tax=Pseudomonas sp. NPDC089752 TaxID=3364472 RepID=UPI003825668E
MKRRKFLQSTAAMVGTVTAGAAIPALNAQANSQRSFGTPGSLIASDAVTQNQLRLTLSKANVPVAAWEDIVSFNSLWDRIREEPSVYHAFCQARDCGEGPLDPALIPAGSLEEKLLLITYDSDLMESVNNHDYDAVFAKLKARGFTDTRSTLWERIRFYEKQELAEILKSSELAGDIENLPAVKKQAMNRIKELLGENSMTLPFSSEQLVSESGAPLVAVVNVGVVTRVLAAVNVGVSVNLAISISIATQMAVTISGTCRSAPSPRFTDDTASVGAASIHLARVSGNVEMIHEIHRFNARQEITACLFAAHKSGYLRLPAAKAERRELVDLFTQLALEIATV